MKCLSSACAVCRIKDICNSLLNVQIKSDYSINHRLYRDKYCESPSATHSSNGTFRFSVVKGIVYITVLAVMISALHALMSCIRD